MNKNIGKNISKNFSQKLLDDAKISATNALKTASKETIQKTEKEQLKIADRTTTV